MKLPEIQEHTSRWNAVKQGREHWTREATTDQLYKAAKLWSQDEMMVFRSEGRPATNFDLIGPFIRLIVGLEAQNRSDLKVLPRTRKSVASAEALTKTIKFVSDQSTMERHMTSAFEDAASLGIGWIESAYSGDPLSERIFVKRVHPFDVWVDPTSRELDLSDARDVFRAVWMRPEDLAEMFPAHADEITSIGATTDREDDPEWQAHEYTLNYNDRPPVALWEDFGYGQDYDLGDGNPNRRHVRAVERWYRVSERAKFAVYKDGRKHEATAADAASIVSGEANLTTGMIRRMRVAIFVGSVLLSDEPSPYSHGRFPFTPIWAYSDEKGRPVGLIRTLRDPAKEYNARRTSMLKNALGPQVLYESNAFPNATVAREELARPNAMVEMSPGGLQKVQFRDNQQGTQTEIELLQQAERLITDGSGVTRELMGQSSNAVSGVAIEQRQSQGQAALYTLFDNRSWAQKAIGELIISMIQDTYTEEQEIRITGSDSGLDWLVVNQRDPNQPGMIINDITQGEYDVVMSEVAASPSYLQAQAQVFMQFLQGVPPQVKMAFLPDLVRGGIIDLPNAAEMADKLQQVLSGMGMGPQGAQHGTQGPPLSDHLNANFKDLPPDAQQAALQQMHLPPSQMLGGPQGPPGQQPPPTAPPAQQQTGAVPVSAPPHP